MQDLLYYCGNIVYLFDIYISYIDYGKYTIQNRIKHIIHSQRNIYCNVILLHHFTKTINDKLYTCIRREYG